MRLERFMISQIPNYKAERLVSRKSNPCIEGLERFQRGRRKASRFPETYSAFNTRRLAKPRSEVKSWLRTRRPIYRPCQRKVFSANGGDSLGFQDLPLCTELAIASQGDGWGVRGVRNFLFSYDVGI